MAAFNAQGELALLVQPVSSAFFVTWLGAGSFAGSFDDAMAAANGLIDAAEATGNPYVLSWALLAYGLAVYDADAVRSLAALRRGLVIAQDSGNRAEQSHLATNLCRFEAEHGDPLAAFDYFTVAIGNYHDSGNTYMIRGPPGVSCRVFRPARTVRAGGHHRRVRRLKPSRCTRPLRIGQHRDCSPPRCGWRGDLRIARSQGRDDDDRRDCDVRIRPIDQARAELNAVSK